MQHILNSIYQINPKDMFMYINEQLEQNSEFSKRNERKIATHFYGSPGVGKTEICEKIPLYRLEDQNTKIIRKFIPKYKLSYNHYESIPIQNQNIIANLDVDRDIKELIKEQLLDVFDTAVVVVRQSDIMTQEDLSGLPSSSSDVRNLVDLVTLAKSHKDIDHKSPFLANLLKQSETVLENINNTNANPSHRNTTKFDYTEWELKVHTIAKDKNIKYIILVFDDIFRSAINNAAILNVMMPIFQQSIVGQRLLPANCSVVITSNESETENGEFNYVRNLDQAQKDRLFSYKVVININDWIKYAKSNKVNKLAIDFIYNNKKIFDEKDGLVTPRRWTQFGCTLYNKFKDLDVKEILKNKNSIDFLLKFNFGDSNNKKYVLLIQNFKSYLTDIDNKTFEFITLLKQNFNEETIKAFNELKLVGHTLKVNIIVHKLIDIIKTEVLTDVEKDNIKLFFESDLLTDSMKYTLRTLNEFMINLYELKTGDEFKENIYSQISYIIKPTLELLAVKKKANESDIKKILDDI